MSSFCVKARTTIAIIISKWTGSAVPMAAVTERGRTDLFISDQPGHCDNYTTQYFLPETGEFYLSSGDPGGSPNFEGDAFSPYYHEVGGGKTHTFRFVAKSCAATSLKAIRREAFLTIDKIWGDGCGSAYHAVSFASNYMHYRRNESGTSDFWIVAGIQYANCQYVRDSFYQTWILPVEMEMQCYHAFREDWLKEAENSLIYLIWSYRVVKKGGTFNRELARKAYDIMMAALPRSLPTAAFIPTATSTAPSATGSTSAALNLTMWTLIRRGSASVRCARQGSWALKSMTHTRRRSPAILRFTTANISP